MWNITKSISLLYVLYISLSSCNQYIDRVNKTDSPSIKQGYFEFYVDSNVLVYTPTVGLITGSKRTNSQWFRIVLPKGIKYYEIQNPRHVSIYYKTDQIIFLQIDLLEGKSQDTSYQLEKMDAEKFVVDISTSGNKKYDISRTKFIKGRSSYLIRKGVATILLFNIKPTKFAEFYNSIQTFGFLERGK